MPRAKNPPADPVSPPPETAADVMIPGPRSCSPFSKAVEAALILKSPGCLAVPIIDAGKPVGTITVHDIAGVVANHPEMAGRSVAEVMSKDPITVPADATLEALHAKFAEAGDRPVLVVDPDGGLRGMVLPGLNGKKVQPLKSDRPAPPAVENQPWWAWARPSAIRDLLRETVNEWIADNVPRLGASLAFYSVLSTAPLLIIVLAIAAMAFGEDAARGQLVFQIREIIGDEGAKAIQDILKNARKPATGTIAALLGIFTLLFDALGRLRRAAGLAQHDPGGAGTGHFGLLPGSSATASSRS
ncbi:MAG: YhjD/YihY/BrkB family envelope integrity protein [Isosphaeraceae bacterium]